MSMQALREMVAAKDLPLGHYDRSKTKAVVADLYRECHAISGRWNRRFPKRFLGEWSVDRATTHCDELCDALGESNKLRRIVSNSPKVYCAALAHYYRGEIHFKWNITHGTLIHELTHHCSKSAGHGEWFCEVLEILLRMSYEILTGKNPKSDW